MPPSKITASLAKECVSLTNRFPHEPGDEYEDIAYYLNSRA